MKYLTVALGVAFLASEVIGLSLESRVTSVADSINASGQSPRPTSGPLAAKAGLKRGRRIFERAASPATCGFVSKDVSSAITCAPGYGCEFFPTDPLLSISYGITMGLVECCTMIGNSIQSENCLAATTCVDYNGRDNTEFNALTVSLTQYCGYSAKKCATWSFVEAPSFFTGSAATQTYTHLFCNSVATIQDVYPTATIPGSSSVPVTAQVNTQDPSNLPLASTSKHRSPNGPGPTSTHHSSSSGPSVAAIAGGTVGGVVALGLIAAAVGVFIWRKRRTGVPPTPEVSTGNYY